MAPGVQLACRLFGEAGAPPMVLLHALGDTAEDWTPIALSLELQFRIVAVDLRGHGESSWPGGYGFEVMRDDVIAVLDAFDLQSITLVGHSMGALSPT